MLRITESNVTIMVADMDKAIQFYETIGLTIKQRWENHYAMMSAEGITIGLHPKEDGETTSGTVSVGFMVEDIAEPKAILDANNITYSYADGGSGTYLNFRDPDNTHVYFVQPKWR